MSDVLSRQRVSREDWVRLTTDCSQDGHLKPGLYHRRCEIETTYRELKVDQGMEKSLRSRSPESIQFEVAGHVVLYFLVRWLMVESGVKHGIDSEEELTHLLIRLDARSWIVRQLPYRTGFDYNTVQHLITFY